MSTTKRSNNGFTLIELIITLVVLGLMAIWITPNIVGSMKKSRDSKRKIDLKAVQQALQSYYTDNNVFPDSESGVISGANWGNEFRVGGVEYMSELPTDPKNAYYYQKLDNNSYILEACLESTTALTDTDSCFYLTCPSGRCYHPGTKQPPEEVVPSLAPSATNTPPLVPGPTTTTPTPSIMPSVTPTGVIGPQPTATPTGFSEVPTATPTRR